MHGGYGLPNNSKIFGVQPGYKQLYGQVFGRAFEYELEFTAKRRHSELRRFCRRLCAYVDVVLSREVSPVS